MERLNKDALLLKAENRPHQSNSWNLINTVYIFLDSLFARSRWSGDSTQVDNSKVLKFS